MTASRASRDAGHVTRVSRTVASVAVRSSVQCERDRRARCTSIVGLCCRSSRQRSSPARDVLSVRATSALSSPTRRNNDVPQSVCPRSSLLSSPRSSSIVVATGYVWTTWRTDASERQLGTHFYLSSIFHRSSRRRKIREIRRGKSEFSLIFPNSNYEPLRMFEGNCRSRQNSLTRDPGITRNSRMLCYRRQTGRFPFSLAR